jgi:hypothetical protein
MEISKLKIHSEVKTHSDEVLVGLRVSMNSLDRQVIKEVALEIFFQSLKRCLEAVSRANKYKIEEVILC